MSSEFTLEKFEEILKTDEYCIIYNLVLSGNTIFINSSFNTIILNEYSKDITTYCKIIGTKCLPIDLREHVSNLLLLPSDDKKNVYNYETFIKYFNNKYYQYDSILLKYKNGVIFINNCNNTYEESHQFEKSIILQDISYYYNIIKQLLVIPDIITTKQLMKLVNLFNIYISSDDIVDLIISYLCIKIPSNIA